MKQFFKFFFACLLALTVAGVLFFVVFFAIVGSIGRSVTAGISNPETPSVVKENSILEIDLTQRFSELSELNSLAIFTGGSSKSVGLIDFLNSIKIAQEDKDIKGIQLKVGGSPNGQATAQQIREALKAFKASGKFIYAYGDYYTQSDYFIASVADSVFVNPMGGVDFKGISSNITFFKGALDKLDVQPQIFYCGQFKSATEPFRLDKMSEPNRKQLAGLQKDIWTQMLMAVSEHTQADTATINNWAQTMTIQTAYDALQYKLVDALWYKDEFETLLRNKTSKKESEKINTVALSDYVKTGNRSTSDSRIAILVGEGEIVDGTGSSSSQQIAAETFVKEIRKVRDNEKIKAVVMRVNSPGGSALASEIILRELQLLQKKKPLVVSMGDVAASGGYYISCTADSIFALPNTITGSIGVFGMFFNTQSFFNKKLGVTFDTEKNTPYADFPNMNRKMTDKEVALMQNGVDSIYLTFKTRVATGRKMDIAYVDSIGQGRVWTGTAALDNKLVDALGNLDRAIQSAATIAHLSKYELVTYPATEDKMNKLMKALGGKDVKEQIIAENLLEQHLGIDYRWLKIVKMLQQPQRNSVWMLMPFVPEIK